MDIRNFFGKKSEPAKNPSVVKRKPKVVIEVDNDDDDDDSDATTVGETTGVATPTPTSTSKSKAAKKPVTNHTNNRVEVDASTFLASSGKTARKMPPSSGTAAPVKGGRKSSRAKRPVIYDLEDDSDSDNGKLSSPPKKKKMIQEDAISEEESPIPTADTNSSANKRKTFDSSDDEVDFDFDNIVENKKKSSPPVKKAKTPTKKIKSAAPKKAPKDEKEALIHPSLKLDSFDTESAASECLSGLTFVFSGVLPDLSREDAIDYVKILGARVTTAVSGKTSYLVIGDVLEDGRPYTDGSKYKKANEVGVIIVKGEKELYGLCKLYSDRVRTARGDHSPNVEAIPQPEPSPSAAIQTTSQPIKANPYAKKPAVNPYAKKATTNPYAKKANSSNPYASNNKKEEPSSSTGGEAEDRNALWADRYAPTSTRDILGNQESVRKLAAWLQKWEHVFNNEKSYGKSFAAPGGPWKAALLSGPPGIGKTTTATLVAKESGRDVLEWNASDARSKKALESGLGDVTGSQVLNFEASSDNKKKRSPHQRRCIIMDEVDGMGAGDRSGMAELIKMIKNSRVPIICICNDRQATKIRSLVPYCMDLRYKRPVKSVIARRAIRIGEQEGMKIEQNAAETIAESCGNDIRQVLNCLQMWHSSKKHGSSITYKGLKERQSEINKDEILRVSMFDATKLIIEGRNGLMGADAKTQKDSLYRRSEAYFVDYSLIGLNVHQNYPKVMLRAYQDVARGGDGDKATEFVERMHDAALAMSDYAVGDHAVRGGDQNWSLLPFVAMMTVKTGFHAGGPNGGFLGGFPEFAGWLGKNSSRGKKTRLLQELAYHMNYKVSSDMADLRMKYVPVLREQFLRLLTGGDKDQIEEAIELMDEYGLDRDDVFETLDEFKIDSSAKGFADLDSKQKTAFTKAYNQGSHKSQALVHEQGAGKVARKSGGTSEKMSGEFDVVDDDVVEESEEEDEELSEEKLKQMFGKKKSSRKSKSDAASVGSKKRNSRKGK